MWTVVYIAAGKREAERIKAILSDEGLLAMLRCTPVSQSGNPGPIEVMVPELEAEEAHEIISSMLPVR